MAHPLSDVTKDPICCPVCDADNYTVYCEPKVGVCTSPAVLYGSASGVRGTQRLVRCRNCTLIYENPRYSETAIIDAYRQASGTTHDSQHEMRRQSYKRTLRSLLGHLPPPPARLLDVGTAGGAFVAAAESLGFTSFGLEPSSDLVRSAVKKGLVVKEGTLDHNPYVRERFQIITLWDVLEHLCEPKRALRNIHALLDESGVLVINYPELDTLPGKLLRHRMWWVQSVHIQHFNRRSIEKILTACGFRAFHFQRFYQTLEFAHLIGMAANLGLPFANPIRQLLPQSLAKLPIRYYAAQTTVVARKT